MSGRLSFRFFAHSWISDWNHGNAHFLRGLASELVRMGHEVRCYEERNGWSMQNMMTEGEVASQAFVTFREWFPELDVRLYTNDASFPDYAARELRGADVASSNGWGVPHVLAPSAVTLTHCRPRVVTSGSGSSL